MNITAFQVKKRCPYYIICSKCEKTISGWDIKVVVEKAREEGWTYEMKSDEVLCEDCKNEKITREE